MQVSLEKEKSFVAQLARAVEHTNCISAKG